MAWVAVSKQKTEKVFTYKPDRDIEFGIYIGSFPNVGVPLPSGTIEKLIGRKLTWEDNPVELTEEMMKPNPKPDIYEGIEWVNDWANFRAFDESGELFEYEEKPYNSKEHLFWDIYTYTYGEEYARICTIDEDVPNWRETLQEREVK